MASKCDGSLSQEKTFPFVAVVEGDLQHAMDNRLRVDDARQFFHSMRSTFSCAIAAAKRSSRVSLRGAAQTSLYASRSDGRAAQTTRRYSIIKRPMTEIAQSAVRT